MGQEGKQSNDNTRTKTADTGAVNKRQTKPEQERILSNLAQAFNLIDQAMELHDRPVVLEACWGIMPIAEELLSQLTEICKILKYSTNQNQWDSSLPLDELARIYPNIESTTWFQWMLGMIWKSISIIRRAAKNIRHGGCCSCL
ncbi:MAG: hypothetical protein A2020_02165 [Lentisphaerae bacterium GWF2_45_14]|nr:MAG: hypothetical protein A2020_02165 [Lentisphaerae bacterium GWF2_45_14]